MSEAKPIVACCGNCRHYIPGTVNRQLVTLCRRHPPAPVPGPGGSVGFVQPVPASADEFCFDYHPDKATQDFCTANNVPVLIPQRTAANALALPEGTRTN